MNAVERTKADPNRSFREDALLDRIENQRIEIERLKAANLFWDDADPEVSATDIGDILDNYPSGEIVLVQRAVRLHDVFAVRIDNVTRTFDTMEAAEAWVGEKISD